MQVDPRVIVSVSGVRGIIGSGLTPELAAAYAAAFAHHAPPGPIVVCRDSRPTGRMLAPAVHAGLMSAGRKVLDAGILPTPTAGVAVRHFAAAGAVQITASHNPSEWNGLKLFGPDGAVLSATEGEQVRRRFEAGDAARAGWEQVGNVRPADGAAEEHCRRVLALADGEAIRARGFRVLLDANGGAGGPLASMLLEALGCAVVAVGAEPDGHFRHPPEPIPAHLAGIGPLVPQSRADVGFVLDPDADRLALVDEAGRCLSEELTLALAVRQRLRRARGPVVINLSTSRAVEDLAEEAGVPCHRSAVGEANVVARMRSEEALIGGEGNGGVIDPRVGWVRDPFVGMALVLGLLAEEGRPLSEAAACLPEYHIVKEKVDVDRAAVPRLLERLEADWPHPASADRRDGLRLGGPWGWVQVRPSNTEPIVRVIAEAADEAGARCLCKTARRLLLAG